jgi:hypothetical protein
VALLRALWFLLLQASAALFAFYWKGEGFLGSLATVVLTVVAIGASSRRGRCFALWLLVVPICWIAWAGVLMLVGIDMRLVTYLWLCMLGPWTASSAALLGLYPFPKTQFQMPLAN